MIKIYWTLIIKYWTIKYVEAKIMQFLTDVYDWESRQGGGGCPPPPTGGLIRISEIRICKIFEFFSHKQKVLKVVDQCKKIKDL